MYLCLCFIYLRTDIFICTNGSTILNFTSKCDMIADCVDGSDEKDCGNYLSFCKVNPNSIPNPPPPPHTHTHSHIHTGQDLGNRPFDYEARLCKSVLQCSHSALRMNSKVFCFYNLETKHSNFQTSVTQ